MSSIQNVITTTFRARGNQAIATMGGISQGFGTIMGRIGETSRMSERLNNQWRAIGTTFRYAIAGTALYGLVSLNSQLREIQQQMGLISAIGETSNGKPLVGGQLDKLLAQSRAGAVEALTPLTDYNNAVINLLSTIQGIPEDQITPIVTQIAQGAKLAQVNAEDATKAFTTMNVAFGRPTNLKNITQMAQEFFILTREAPGGVAAGQQVITQLGQLAQVTRLAHGTPEDMFSLLLTTLRSGIPPNQAGRGLQFLIQTVGLPGQQVKASQQALASVGITPGTDMPLQERLARIFTKARSLGVHGDINRLKNLDEDTLADLDAQGGTTGGLKQLGISGRGAEFLGQIFRRIHALRTALAIQGQIDTGQAQKDLTEINRVAQGHVSDINNIHKAWDRFRKQARLQEAAISLNTLGIQVAQAFEPIINLAASGIINISDLARQHPKATKAAALGAGGFLAAMGVGRFLGLGGLLKGGFVGRGFVAKTALEDAMAQGGLGLGASPQNPLYVIVVGEIFGKAVSGGSPLPGGGGNVPPIIAGGGRGVLGRLIRSPVGKGLGVIGVLAAVHEAGLDTAFGKAIGVPDKYHGKQGWPALFRAMGLSGSGKPKSAPFVRDNQGLNVDQAIQFFNRDNTNQPAGWQNRLQRVQQLFGMQYGNQQIWNASQPKLGKFNGRADVFMTIDLKDPTTGKITRKKVHVPVTMWEGGRFPSKTGKAGSSRSSG